MEKYVIKIKTTVYFYYNGVLKVVFSMKDIQKQKE